MDVFPAITTSTTLPQSQPQAQSQSQPLSFPTSRFSRQRQEMNLRKNRNNRSDSNSNSRSNGSNNNYSKIITMPNNNNTNPHSPSSSSSTSSSFQKMKTHVLMGIILVFALYVVGIQHYFHLEKVSSPPSSFLVSSSSSSSSSPEEKDGFPPLFAPEYPHDTNSNNRNSNNEIATGTPEKQFSCSVFWLRMPKTASTSVMRTFIGPLFQSGKFTNTEMDPNTCLMGVGGCDPFWGGWRQSQNGGYGNGGRYGHGGRYGGGRRYHSNYNNGRGGRGRMMGPGRGDRSLVGVGVDDGRDGRGVEMEMEMEMEIEIEIETGPDAALPPPPPYDYRILEQQQQQQSLDNIGNNETHQHNNLRETNPNHSLDNNLNNNLNNHNHNHQRCFPKPSGPSIHCYEYNPQTSTINFGPHRRNPKRMRQQLELKRNPNMPIKYIPDPPSLQTARYDYSPSLKTHVGLDPTLFGWVMPEHTMVFSTFRDPIERLLSSFHYGIQFGGGRPGEVDKCQLPGVEKLEDWQQRVVEARQLAAANTATATDGQGGGEGDTAVYQQLLKDYLTTCKSAADNTYVQFLDPNTKNVDVALHNLETYVIVGLQTNVEESLERWMNITLKNCHDRPQYPQVVERLRKEFRLQGGKRWRASDLLTNSDLKLDGTLKDESKNKIGEGKDGSDSPSAELVLASPKFESFDEDLQKLIREYTVGDEVIFKRALEMYEEQRHWGL